MKKFIAILAVAGVMTACNSTKTDEAKKDSVTTAVDTSAKKVDSAAVKVDSTKTDSTKK